tara:strand:- start:10896 stop:11213 length:318 start_codon:yes stop_codon:yes gene_type:complete
MKYYNLGILFIFLSLIVILTSYYYTGLTRPLEKEIEVIQLKINSAEKQIKINELEFAAHLNHEYLKKLESVYFSNKYIKEKDINIVDLKDTNIKNLSRVFKVNSN